MNRRTNGVILSYLMIVIDIVVGIVFVPFLLQSLGADEYGLYKLLLSTASYLSVLDFGIGGTITQYVIKFKTEEQRQQEENFVAMGLIIYGVLSAIVVIAGFGFCMVIPTVYEASISPLLMKRAQIVLFIMCCTTAVQLFNHAFNGLITAYECFVFSRLSNIVKVLLRILLIIIGLQINARTEVIVIVDLSLALLLLLCNYLYCKYVMREHIHLYKWDGALAREAGTFTLAILVQAIIYQFNSNVDNIVLGIYSTTALIATYSLSVQMYTMYSNLSTAICTVYSPSISAAVFRCENDHDITKRLIEPSRIQLMVLLLALTGFYLYGREFINIWVGEEHQYAYILSCLLMTASTIELSQNTVTSVLKAKNKLHARSIIIAVSTAANAAITFLLVPRIGPIGAAIGTAFSLVAGYGIAMNIYYYKVIHIDLKLFFKEICRGILPAVAVALACGVLVERFILIDKLVNSNLLNFLIHIVTYICIYVVSFFCIGLNTDEKQKLKQMGKLLKKFKRK